MDQLNNTYQDIWEEIKNHEHITICSHINPDGDTIAVALAMKELININLPQAEVKISGDVYPRYLQFLPAAEKVSDQFFNQSLKIVVDTSTPKRIWDQRVIPQEAIKLDHHHHEAQWKLEVGGDHWPATGEVIYELIQDRKLQTNKFVEELLFISIWTDTEQMTQRNISAQTHHILNSLSIDAKSIKAKMALTKEEKAIIEAVSIEVHGNVTYGFSEHKIPNDIYRQYINHIFDHAKTEVILGGAPFEGSYRFGLRSRGNVDVSQFAKMMGGGGHFSSAGFKINDKATLNTKINQLIRKINNA